MGTGYVATVAVCVLLMITSAGLSGQSNLTGGYFLMKISSWIEETGSIKYAFLTKKSCSRSFDILLDIKEAVLEAALAVT